MLKKRIEFKDLDGNQLVEDFYFNLTKAEIAEMELSKSGGLSEHLQEIVKSKDGGEIIRTFKDILRASYGKRSEDGKRFMKKPEYFEEFLETDAYSVLFMQLVTDADASSAFIRGVVPQELTTSAAQDKPSLEAVEALKRKLAEPPKVVPTAPPPAMSAIEPAKSVTIGEIVEQVRNSLPEDDVAALREMTKDELIERLRQVQQYGTHE